MKNEDYINEDESALVRDDAAFDGGMTPRTTFEKESQDETEYVESNPKLMEAIKEGDKQIASGKYESTKLEDLWK